MGSNTPYRWWRSLLNRRLLVLPAVLLTLLIGNVQAQSMLGSLTINSNPVIELTSVSDYENGVAITDQTLTITTNASMNWVLKVRSAGNPDRMGAQIPAARIGMKVTNLPASPPEILLSTFDQDIAGGASAAVMQTIPVTIQYRAMGGADFLQPAGDYTVSLTFTLTMVNL